MKRCDGTTWKASPAWTYSMIRETVASNCSRLMLDWKSIGAFSAVGSTAGTGSRSCSRTSPIVSTARAYASSIPPSSTNALAISVTSWRWWSKATSTSVIIRAMSGSPTGSGFGSGSGSTVRTRS